MPDGGIILILFVLAFVAASILYEGIRSRFESGPGGVFSISFIAILAGSLWLGYAATHRPVMIEWFWLHTVTCNDGTVRQVFFDGDEVNNATQLLGRLYPDDGWVIERTKSGDKKCGITFRCFDGEVSYRVIAPNEGSPPNERIEHEN